MKALKRLPFAIIVACLTVTLLACNNNRSDVDHEALKKSLSELKTKLDSGQTLQRQEPFGVRSFEPYVDGDWIGKGVSYGCYRAGQAPGQMGPSDDEILEDLNIITNYWNLIRVYGADKDTERIISLIKEHKLPIRVMLGIWLEPEESNPDKRDANIEQVLKGVRLANLYPDIVIAVSVGNETQVFWSGHKMNPINLIRYIRAVRNNVALPVTTADDYNFWNKPESKPVADEIDFIVTHIHPLWNGKTLDNAIDWIDETYQEIKDSYHDKSIVIGETGWATDFNPDKTGPGEQGTLIKGEVNLDAQGDFLINLNKWVESKHVATFIFEAFDEPWKGGGAQSEPNHVEKNWGIFYESRTPKESFLKFLTQVDK